MYTYHVVRTFYSATPNNLMANIIIIIIHWNLNIINFNGKMDYSVYTPLEEQ